MSWRDEAGDSAHTNSNFGIAWFAQLAETHVIHHPPCGKECDKFDKTVLKTPMGYIQASKVDSLIIPSG